MQRLSESATDRGKTLWAAVNTYLQERQVARKAEVLTRFCHDDEASVRGILNDLVQSGLVYQTGRGDATLFRVASDEDLARLGESSDAETHAAIVWIHVHQHGAVTESELAQRLPLKRDELHAALVRLCDEARITDRDGSYSTNTCLIPLGSAAGWEAAVVDHHRAMLNALALKIRGGAHASAASDEVGGSTFTFDLCPGHPQEAEVRALLASTRQRLASLWNAVVEHNAGRPRGDSDYRVTFYFGQSVQEREGGDES